MKKLRQQTWLLATLAALFMTTTVLSGAAEEQQKRRIAIGERVLPKVERLKMQEARAERAAEQEEAEEAPIVATLEEESQDRSARALFYKTSHEGVFQAPISITLLGDEIELLDGSLWYIRPADRFKTLDWMITDTVVIMQNTSWFSSYDFVMVNLNTGDRVEVDMTMGPYYAGIYTYYIVAIDYFADEILLNDGSVWDISIFDNIGHWMVNDTVIIGINDAFSLFNPNILINVNTLDYVEGHCIN